MSGWLRRVDGVIELLAGLGVLAYCLAAAVSVGDVIGRRIGTPIPGVVDLVQLFVMAGAWLTIPWGFIAGAHVGVDFLLARMPVAASRALQIVAAFAAVLLMGLILWYAFAAYRMQVMMGDKSQQLGIPISLYWVPLLVGVAASIVAALAVAARLASGRAVAQSQAH